MFGPGRPESRGPQGETNGGLKSAAKTEPQLLRVNRVCASSSGVKIVVGGLPVEAKIDSGAEITILSTTAFEQLREKPKKLRGVNMQLADQGSTMRGFVTRPVGLKIGGMTFHEQVHVAPISDQMLLGHDLLHHWGVIHDMGTNTTLIGNERIPLKMNVQNSLPTVGRVTASRRAVIPPNSVVRLSGKLDTTLGDYYIEPVDASHLFIPRTVRKADECPVVCLVNLSDQYQSVKKGQFLENAYEVQEVLDPMQEDLDHGKEGTTPDHVFCGSVQVNDSTTPTTGRVPEHLQQLAADSSAYLTVDQREELGKLLSEFEDVFAKHDFDLGEFTTIEHAIDTGDANPIKQGMRRTPAVFAGEEEAHLRKMLDAGVIQESISEWASAPVLIRKKDGTVRWCIDYRALNDVTVKDTFPLPLVNDCLDALSGSTWF
ncbi:hypothetical protein ACOMHN_015802 [Nucella lapillus]